ncbi:hypothetical protein CVT25_008425 [Psilocybe cyanescens]|uniref:Uncharacterized protein n=1 Tax=Psilocybe cyanescens TaxID=93625 RepID=A0A409WUS8_PSICY|nr:hypothetical protein CVT25_008425 [Psilocybe cyanescens]
MEEELEETEPIMDITNTTDAPLEDFNALVIDFIKAKDSEEMDQAWINAKTTASQTLAMEHENIAMCPDIAKAAFEAGDQLPPLDSQS